ncbi:hypothetical protein CFE70_007030 [Pyrenophora teres f. teres 0-1]
MDGEVKVHEVDSNRFRSPLMRLPAELRNYVYELVMGEGAEVRILYEDEILCSRAESKAVKAFVLVQICRQIAKETSVMLSHRYTFEITPIMNVYFKHRHPFLDMAMCTRVRVVDVELRCAFMAYDPWNITDIISTRKTAKSVKLCIPSLVCVRVNENSILSEYWALYIQSIPGFGGGFGGG